jgi:hypothetical protein
VLDDQFGGLRACSPKPEPALDIVAFDGIGHFARS